MAKSPSKPRQPKSAKPRSRPLLEIVPTTDTADILARARKQAIDRGLDDYFIVDVDSHIDEGGVWPEVMSFLENDQMRDAATFFGGGTGR